MSADYSAFIAEETVLVVDGDAGLTGSLTLMERPDHLLIWSIAVAPDAQGTGLGGRMMRYCEGFARKRGLPEIRLFTHALMRKNREWYKRLSYIEVGEEWVGDKHRVNLVKHLG
nr:GNAT family N-acetyltransferase [Hongsoonwoonella zoysiae]